jgi:hypothetical protein
MKVADFMFYLLIREQNPLVDLSNKGKDSSNQVNTNPSSTLNNKSCLCSIWKWMIHLWLVDFQEILEGVPWQTLAYTFSFK